MTAFSLAATPLLASVELNRWPQARASVTEPWEKGQLFWLNHRAQFRLDGAGLAFVKAREFASDPPEDAILVAVLDEVPIWALRSPREDTGEGDGWTDLRQYGAKLDPHHAALVTTAMSLLNWNEKARFCARDGAPTVRSQAGWSRTCSNGHEEFPRTDPAIICIVHDGADMALLARASAWTPNRFSALAGFVEAGESLEACVRREVREEVGVDVTDIRYLGSQPWPFPRSLMLAFSAVADPKQVVSYLDGEIEAAHWFTRDQVLKSLEYGDWTAADGELPHPVELLVPPSISIARQMIAGWALGSTSGN